MAASRTTVSHEDKGRRALEVTRGRYGLVMVSDAIRGAPVLPCRAGWVRLTAKARPRVIGIPRSRRVLPAYGGAAVNTLRRGDA